jgi:hypothetical protein
MMRLTGTFLDEISFDIPHHNWGMEEWDKDFRAMKAMGIKRVIMIRCANKNFMTYDSKVIRKHSQYMMHTPPIDLVDMFLTLAEKYDMEYYFGTWHFHPDSCRNWKDPEIFKKEGDINIDIISEVQERYGHRKAFHGWYLTHEVHGNNPGTIDLFIRQGDHAKKISGGKPTLISPYFAGVKANGGTTANGYRPLTVEEHTADWEQIFRQLQGYLDYVAFQDGHVNFQELAAYHKATRILADKYGITTWTNIESFDRDMPIKFPPIKWEKFLWKLESAEAAGIQDGITFEFSHFMSPNSMYQSAHGLYDRYCEYFGIPARSKDFR